MIRRDLLDILNSGRVWTFIGSGSSIEAGIPSWKRLVELVLDSIDPNVRTVIQADTVFSRSLSAAHYPGSFSVIERHIGREALDQAIRASLPPSEPGRLLELLADWPFTGIVTTNYDNLIEKALASLGQAWISVGNAPAEVNMVTGDADKIVWHIHGAVHLPQAKSKLIITEGDYEELYLESSPVVTHVRTLLTSRRTLFVGFGFTDPELLRLLRLVGRYGNPARPSYALLPQSPQAPSSSEFRERYNIEIIPYQVRSDSHHELIDLLDFYGVFLLRRSMRFGRPRSEPPDHDPITASLLIYNDLVLRQKGLHPDILESLARARVLSLLSFRTEISFEELAEELRERIDLLHQGRYPRQSSATLDLLTHVVRALELDRLIARSGDGPGITLTLTEAGKTLTAERAATAKRIAEAFRVSLETRATRLIADDAMAAQRVAAVARDFLTTCITRRALGLSMAWQSPDADVREYQLVVLLQALPQFLEQLPSGQEALALVRLIQNLLAHPDASEAQYLGLQLQAEFGLNLLGYDPDTVSARVEALSETLFIIDSTSLISSFARSSSGHRAAALLLQRLNALGSDLSSTYLLGVEVAEHARWPMKELRIHQTPLSTTTLRAATGRLSFRSNAFLDGFVQELSAGSAPLNYPRYLEELFGIPVTEVTADSTYIESIRSRGIPSPKIEEWEGFTSDLGNRLTDLEEDITKRRMAQSTFQHERQVRAEAEALLVVQAIRDGMFKFAGKLKRDAYFISQTRIIDLVAGTGRPITMRQQAALQWLSTVTACHVEELESH